MQTKKPRQRVTWTQFIPENEWSCYEDAIRVVRKSKADFLIGGAFGLAVYTGRWRDTKDLDLLILPRDRESIVQALSDSGFVDYYDQHPYDRGWIYRATRDGFIVDVIWEMANRRAQVDELWFQRAPLISIRTEKVRVVPAEELLWHKLYVLQRDRCDWPDVLNLLYENGPTLDWEYLIKRLEDDTPLLKAALTIFDWLCPAVSRELPDAIRARFELRSHDDAQNGGKSQSRVSLLDSRQWFAGSQSANKKLGN